MDKNNPAKFAFFYLLALISLISLAMAVGNIIFQIINKNVLDVLNELRGSYSSSTLRFAISSIIISAPVFYFVSIYIYKSLSRGELDKDSQIRKWLSYLILLISFITMSGWLIGIVFNFLDGELTLKFILKALAAIGIAGIVFSYYFYDLRRKEVVGVRDKLSTVYFYSTIVIVFVSLVSAFLFVESPSDARLRKIDNETITRLSDIDASIQNFYDLNQDLPNDLNQLLSGPNTFLREMSLYDPSTGNMFEYKSINNMKYEICADFKLSNKGVDTDDMNSYLNDKWLHDAGRQCFQRAVININKLPMEIIN